MREPTSTRGAAADFATRARPRAAGPEKRCGRLLAAFVVASFLLLPHALPAQAPPPAPQQAMALPPEPPPGPPAWLVPLWTSTLPAPPAAAPAFDEAHAYVPLRDGQLAAVRLADGARLWSAASIRPLSVAAGEGLVVAATPEGIRAFGSADGKLRWTATLDRRVTVPPVFASICLVTIAEDGAVLALSPADGSPVWRRELHAAPTVAPAIDSGRVIASLADGRVVTLSLTDGRTVWERQLGGAPAEVAPASDRLFVGSRDNFLYCLSARDGRIRWRWRTGGDVVGRPVVDDRRVYFSSLDNLLRALDRGNGHQQWKRSLATRPLWGPTALDQLLLISGIAPQLWAYRKTDGVLAAEVPLPAELVGPPYHAGEQAPAHVVLVVTTGDGRMQALIKAPLGHPVRGLPLYLALPSSVPSLGTGPIKAPAGAATSCAGASAVSY